MENDTLKVRLFSGKKLESLFIYDAREKNTVLTGIYKEVRNFYKLLGHPNLILCP